MCVSCPQYSGDSALDRIDSVIAPVRAFSRHVHRSPLAWCELQRLQRVFLAQNGFLPNAKEEHSDDEVPSEAGAESGDDAGYLSDDLARNAEGTPLPHRVLRISGYCKTRWNSTYFLIKRVLLLEQSIQKYLQNKKEELKSAKDMDSSFLFEGDVWLGLRQLVTILEPIRKVSERLEGDTYITISDALYFLLKLLYDKMGEVDESIMGCDVGFVVASTFKEKLLESIDDPNLIYSWGLAACIDGRQPHVVDAPHMGAQG